jgi:hypothetical protein
LRKHSQIGAFEPFQQFKRFKPSKTARGQTVQAVRTAEIFLSDEAGLKRTDIATALHEQRRNFKCQQR